MGWFGKLTFGTLGLFFGGPLGAIAGAVLGHHMIDKKASALAGSIPRPSQPDDAERAQAAYFISLFSILGKLSKVDGVVSHHEIAVTERFISGLQIGDREKQFAKQVFREARNSRYSIADFASQLYQTSKRHPAVLLSFFDLLFQIAAADGTLHPAEETALKRIQEIFRITDPQFDNLKAVYFKELDRHYKMLNCTPQSSDEEIKSNYKKLVKDFHPDRIISKGLPDEFTDFATKRFREIQEAYNAIKKERNL